MANNYNTNSNGPDIEAHCCYDNFLSEINFKETFEHVQELEMPYSRRQYTKFWIVEHGILPSHKDLSYKIVIKDYRAARQYMQNEYELGYDEYKSKAALAEAVESYISETNDAFFNFAEEELSLELADNGIEVLPTYKGKPITIDYMISKGYSQGDYAEVYFSPEIWLDCIGGAFPEDTSWISNMLWDAPIICRVTINGEDYYYDEWPNVKSAYDWDRKGFIAWLVKETGIDASEFEALLPETPEYN